MKGTIDDNSNDIKPKESDESVNTAAVETKLYSTQKPLLQPKDATEDIAVTEKPDENPDKEIFEEDIAEKGFMGESDSTNNQIDEIVNEDEEGFIGPKLPRLESVCGGKAKKEASEEICETDDTVIKVKGEDEAEVEDGEGPISKEDFLEFVAPYTQERKADWTKLSEDLKTDLWRDK